MISCSHQGKDKYLLETRAQKIGLRQTRKGSSLGPGSPGPQLASHGASPNGMKDGLSTWNKERRWHQSLRVHVPLVPWSLP